MPKTPKIIPISDLRQNASNVVRGVSSSREPVFITRRGRAAFSRPRAAAGFLR
jgi:PHD/YefM family antitoxin component YafN of YafNO toxin-antitoxin module